MSDEKVDTRVVELDFDNKKFEKNVKKTQSSLKDLDDSLQMKGASSGIDTVIAKFSALDVAAATIVARITNRIVDLGVSLVKSLSIDQVSAGWDKFGQKTSSMATLASQTIKIAGKEITNYSDKLEAINTQLDKLNWFTDETSYNFTDMVDNIGKFTAAGQDLDASVEAMMGIANWAALSGQNATMASRAMYNLAQALSKGYVQLIDYKSIQNANMDTQEFRQTVLDTAVAMGELTKEGENYITKTGKKFTKNQFTEELSSKWFTSDVLTASLGKYSAAVDKIYEIAEETGMTASEVMSRYGDTLDEFGLKAFKAAQEARTFADALSSVKDAVSTGWMNTAEKIFGSYDESKELWTDLANELYNVFASGGDFRNEVLQTWKDLEGRADLFKHGGEDQGAFWNLFDAVTAVIDLVKSSFNEVFQTSVFEDEADKAADLGSKFKDLTARLKDWSARVKDAVSENSEFANILRAVFTVVKLGLTSLNAIKYALDPVVSVIKYLVQDLLSRVSYYLSDLSFLENIFTKITDASNKMANVLSDIFDDLTRSDVFDQIFKFLEDLFKELANAKILENFASIIKSFFKSFSNEGKTLEAIKTIIYSIVTILIKLGRVLLKLASLINKYIIPAVAKLLSFLADISGGLIGTLTQIISYVFELIAGLVDFKAMAAKFTGLFSSFQTSDITVKFEPLASFFEGLKDLFISVISVFKSFLPVIQTVISNIGKLFKAVAAGITSWLGKIDFEGIKEKITSFFSSLKMDKASSGVKPIQTFLEGVKTLLSGIISAFKAFIPVFSNFFIVIGKIFSSIGNILNKLFAAAKENSGLMAAIVRVSVVLVILLAVLMLVKKTVGKFDDVLDSLSGLMDSLSGKLKAGIFQSVASSLLKMVLAIAILSSISDDKLIFATAVFLSLVGVMAAMVALCQSINSTKAEAEKAEKNTKYIQKLAAATLKMAVGILLIAKAIETMSKLSWEQLGIGITGAAAAVAIVIALSYVMDKIDTKKMVAASLVMTVVAASVKAIGKAFQSFENISPDTFILGSAVILGIMFALSHFATSMSSAVAGISNVISLVALPATLILLAGAIMSLALAFATFALIPWQAIVAGLLTVIGSIVALAIINKIFPDVASTMALMSVSFLAISVALLVGALAFKVFTDTLAAFAVTVVSTMGAILAALIDNITLINEAVTGFISGLLDSILLLAPKLADTVVGVFLETIKVLTSRAVEFAQYILQTIVAILKVVNQFKADIFELVLEFITSLLESVASKAERITGALIDIWNGIVKALSDRIETILRTWMDFVINFINAFGNVFREKSTEVGRALFNLGKNIMIGLWNGIVEFGATAIEGMGAIGEAIANEVRRKFQIHSPSRLMYKMGGYIMEGLGNGMTDNADYTVRDAADSMTEVASAINDTLEDTIDDDNLTITPVLDLSNVESGADSISSMMSNISGGKISMSAKLANTISRGFGTNKISSNGQNGVTNNNNSSTENYYSTFNVTADDPEEFARQADILLQKRRLRSNLAKGGV